MEEGGEKRIDKGIIEATLNSYAADGWRLRQIALCGNLGLIYVFEQENKMLTQINAD